MRLKIKICGLKYPDNILGITALRPDYIGFICYPESKRFIGQLDEELIRNLDLVKKTGVFVNAEVDEMIELVNRYHFDALQLHGDETTEICAAIRQRKPELEIIKAFGIGLDVNWSSVEAYDPFVDYYLFDTASHQYGGTGEKFDWNLLKNYKGSKLFFLSGGINPENILDASQLEDPRLFALDLNSKFEIAPGLKDVALLKKTLEKISNE